jgi:hypothetical protein
VPFLSVLVVKVMVELAKPELDQALEVLVDLKEEAAVQQVRLE